MVKGREEPMGDGGRGVCSPQLKIRAVTGSPYRLHLLQAPLSPGMSSVMGPSGPRVGGAQAVPASWAVPSLPLAHKYT